VQCSAVAPPGLVAGVRSTLLGEGVEHRAGRQAEDHGAGDHGRQAGDHGAGDHAGGDPLDWLRGSVPGEPGVDYPILASIQVHSWLGMDLARGQVRASQ
jgi:hypothetical protein